MKDRRTVVRLLTCALLPALAGFSARPERPLYQYVFFGGDRDALRSTSAFWETPGFAGAQVSYTWRSLEPRKDDYDFSAIRDDLALLSSRGKRLFIQLQDVTFSAQRIPVPDYLLDSAAYGGGIARQYRDGAEGASDVAEGWTTRRWDPRVQQRWWRLLDALGREFDGRIEGVNFAESSVDFGRQPEHQPSGFTPEAYRDALIANMRALRRAFPRSVAVQYANFMPGEWRPTENRGLLDSVYRAAVALGVGVGGPDVLPFRRGQLRGSYPLIREASRSVPVAMAVQDGNYADLSAAGRRASVPELAAFAREELGASYLFWCTEEPYFSAEVVPFVQRGDARQPGSHGRY